MTWAVKQKVGNATGKAILLMLANYADDTGECFPSQEKLALECECSVATVQRWLKAFEAAGALNRRKQYGENGYRRADRLVLRTDLHITMLPSTELPSTEFHNSASILTPHKARAEPIKEPSSLRSLSKSARGEDEFRAALSPLLESPLIETFIEHRRKKRAAINGNAGTLLLAALQRCPDPHAAAGEMALRGWTSVKPEWLESRQHRTGPPGPKPRPAEDVIDNLINRMDGANAESPSQIERHQAPLGRLSAA
jgi:hypothetical protein